jgi:Predicted permease
MRLPWDSKYIKISFHVVVSVLVIFAVVMGVGRFGYVALSIKAFFNKLFSVSAPLIIGIVAAFLFDPMVEFFDKRFNKKHKTDGFVKRTKGTAITYIIVFAFIGVGIRLMVSNLGETDVLQFADVLNWYLQGISEMLLSLQRSLSAMGILSSLNGIINSLIGGVTSWIRNVVIILAGSVTSVGTVVLNLVIGLVAAFYFLSEKDRILFRLKDTMRAFLPQKTSDGIETFAHDANTVFSGYVTGQIIDAFIMASLIIVSFWAAGIKYAVIIGIISGFSNLIPYIGAVVAFVLSVMVGLVSGTPIKAVYAGIIVIILQQIDSMIIVPRVVGRSVKLHPVLVILSLSFFGRLFGLWGMIIAVPTTALLKIYLDRVYNKRKNNTIANK